MTTCRWCKGSGMVTLLTGSAECLECKPAAATHRPSCPQRDHLDRTKKYAMIQIGGRIFQVVTMSQVWNPATVYTSNNRKLLIDTATFTGAKQSHPAPNIPGARLRLGTDGAGDHWLCNMGGIARVVYDGANLSQPYFKELEENEYFVARTVFDYLLWGPL